MKILKQVAVVAILIYGQSMIAGAAEAAEQTLKTAQELARAYATAEFNLNRELFNNPENMNPKQALVAQEARANFIASIKDAIAPIDISALNQINKDTAQRIQNLLNANQSDLGSEAQLLIKLARLRCYIVRVQEILGQEIDDAYLKANSPDAWQDLFTLVAPKIEQTLDVLDDKIEYMHGKPAAVLAKQYAKSLIMELKKRTDEFARNAMLGIYTPKQMEQAGMAVAFGAPADNNLIYSRLIIKFKELEDSLDK